MSSIWVVFLLSAVVGPADRDALRAHLRVDTSEVESGAPVIQRRIEERGSVVLRQAEVLPGQGATDAVIAVRVREIGGEDPGFELEMTLTAAGASHPERSRVFRCPLCTETEVVERAEQEIAGAVPRLREISAREATGTLVGRTDPARPGDPGPGPAPGKKPAVDRRLAAGLGLAAPGAVAIGVGIGLALRKDQVDPDDPLNARSTRGPGYATLAVGGAALLAGIVLIAIGGHEQAKRLELAPTASREGFGLVVGGRF